MTPGDAQAVLEQIEDILPVVSVFFELGRENASVPVQGMRVFRLPEILRHTRLELVSQVIECLDVINDALRHVRHDPEAMICAVDREGRCFVAEATSHAILTLWQGIVASRGLADAGETRPGRRQHGSVGGLLMNRVARDLTPVVDLSLESGTGPFRTRRPVYVDLLPPCNHACPAGENIQGWLALAQAGEYRKAWETAGRRQPAAGHAWPGLLPSVRKRLQSRAHGCRGVDPCGGTLPRRHGEGARAGTIRPPRRRPASACWWSAPGRAACRPPIT